MHRFNGIPRFTGCRNSELDTKIALITTALLYLLALLSHRRFYRGTCGFRCSGRGVQRTNIQRKGLHHLHRVLFPHSNRRQFQAKLSHFLLSFSPNRTNRRGKLVFAHLQQSARTPVDSVRLQSRDLARQLERTVVSSSRRCTSLSRDRLQSLPVEL